GHESNQDLYSVARLTIPSGGDGTYNVAIGVRSYIDGASSGDTDFHILKNNAEIFTQFLPGNGSATYSNSMQLTAGDYLDFVCGHGADGRSYNSALKFASKITLIDTNATAPTILRQPQSLTVEAGTSA